MERASDGTSAGTRANVRAAGIAMLIAVGLMAVFNSDELRSYARDLPDGWLADAAIVGADRWHEFMLAFGPANAQPAIRNVFEAMRETRW